MKNRWQIYLAILFVLNYSSAAAATEELDILISNEIILKKTENLFYDDKIPIDIDHDGSNESIINYSFSRIGPTKTCMYNEICSPETAPAITFFIDSKTGRAHINFICTSIGIFHKKTKGRRDIFCGPSTILIWNGREYVDKQNSSSIKY